MWFLFGEVSSSSGCLGWATLYYCGTPCAIHIIIKIWKVDAIRGLGYKIIIMLNCAEHDIYPAHKS